MSVPELTPAPPMPSPAIYPTVVPAHLLTSYPTKVRDCHLDRKVIIYIHQSSPQQVTEYKESTARQCAPANVTIAIGWHRNRVEVVDTDQGRTAQTIEGRRGIQYILAELSHDHVCIFMRHDDGRLARSAPD